MLRSLWLSIVRTCVKEREMYVLGALKLRTLTYVVSLYGRPPVCFVLAYAVTYVLESIPVKQEVRHSVILQPYEQCDQIGRFIAAPFFVYKMYSRNSAVRSRCELRSK